MTVTVTPTEFHFVRYDAAVVERITLDLLDRLGMTGRDVLVDIDEATPLIGMALVSSDPITLKIEGGALENPKALRTLSKVNVANAIGRLLLHARDRAGPFTDAPPDGQLTLAQRAAWETYSNGRLERLGYDSHRSRWLYHFRSRHGFTDAVDAAFERLWNAENLSWSELSTLSRSLTDAAASVPER